MSDEFSSNCSICQHGYDEGGIRQGLLLPCGHPFCRCCLQKLEDNCNKNCPICRHNWTNARVSVLPLYTPVAREEEVGGAGKAKEEEDEDEEDEDTCKKHGFDLLFWCQSCELSTCKSCMKEGHKRCEWMMLEDALDAINGIVKQNAGRTSKKLLSALEGVKRTSAKCSEELSNIRYFLSAVQDSERQLMTYSKKLVSLEGKISRDIEELQNIDESADKQNIHVLQRSKCRLDQLAKAVDVPRSPKLHMSAVAQAYKELEGRRTGADFLSELSSEVLKKSQDAEAAPLQEEDKPAAKQVEAAAAERCQSPVKSTAEVATQVETEEVISEDEGGETSSGAPTGAPCTRCSAEDPQLASDAVLPEGGDWDISDPDTAAAAVTRLLTTRVRPSCLTVTVDASWHQLQVTNLLKVVGHKPCSVRLRFLDSFMLLEDGGLKKDEERLKALRFGNQRCTIEEYWGCLSSDNLNKILERPALQVLGLPLNSAEDAKVLTGLQNSHKEGGLSVLHLHITKKIKPQHFKTLDVSKLATLSRCYLHCPLVAGDDLNWLVEVLDKLVSAKGRKMWSVVLSLLRNSLIPVDLDRLLGLLRDHSLTELELQLDSADISDMKKLDLTKQLDKSSWFLKWFTDYSLPIEEVNSTDSVVTKLSSSLLPALVTFDQTRQLVKEAIIPTLDPLKTLMYACQSLAAKFEVETEMERNTVKRLASELSNASEIICHETSRIMCSNYSCSGRQILIKLSAQNVKQPQCSNFPYLGNADGISFERDIIGKIKELIVLVNKLNKSTSSKELFLSFLSKHQLAMKQLSDRADLVIAKMATPALMALEAASAGHDQA